MAHNRSPRRVISDTLALPLSGLADTYLEIDCGQPGCARGRSYRVGDLAVYGPATLGAVLLRLRCERCRGGPKLAVLWADLPGRRHAGSRRVVLRGTA